MPSFSTRCIIQWRNKTPREKKFLYEERITFWQCKDLDEAIELGEAEAVSYAKNLGETCLDLVQAYLLKDVLTFGNGTEIFSLLRESDLPAKEYLDRHFDTGFEREQSYGSEQ